MKVAARLADVRLSDPERRETTLSELSRASLDPATKMLMISPLQVTILFGISLVKGAIPQDRWDLFEKYYNLLRDREAQKPGDIGAFLRNFKRQIDALHQVAGFLLQVAAESAGRANSYLSPEQFRTLVRRLLQDDDYDERQVDDISDQLVRIATERLVLLSAKVENRIAFDVRSLQEFMAAAQITAVADIPLGQRLRAIATNAHWRHVFRIIASKIFSVAELGHYRDEVLMICHAADAGDLGEDGHTVKAGAKLAIDLLSDGIAASTPRFRKQLVRRAFAHLDLGPAAFEGRIINHYDMDTEEIFQQELVVRLQQGFTLPAQAAWKMLFALLKKSEHWAEALILRHWPHDPGTALDAIANTDPHTWTAKIRSEALRAQSIAGLTKTLAFADRLRQPRTAASAETRARLPSIGEVVPISLSLIHHPPEFRTSIDILANAGTPLSSMVVFLERCPEFRVNRLTEYTHPSWDGFRAILPFLDAPSATSLACALDQLAKTGPDHAFARQELPWVLRSILQDYLEGVDLKTLASEAAGGRFGELQDWQGAERRWRNRGLVSQDFETWNDGRYLSNTIATVGAPSLYVLSRGANKAGKDGLGKLLAIVENLHRPAKQIRLLEGLIFALERIERPGALVHRAVHLILRVAGELDDSMENRLVSFIVRYGKTCWRNPNILRLIEQLGRRESVRRAIWDHATISEAVKAFNRNSELRGLLPFISDCLITRIDVASAPHLGAQAFMDDAADQPILRSAVARLRLITGRWEAGDIQNLITALTEESRELANLDLRALVSRSGIAKHAAQKQFVRLLVTRLAEIAPEKQYPLIALISQDLDAHPTPISNDEKRNELRLPSL